MAANKKNNRPAPASGNEGKRAELSLIRPAPALKPADVEEDDDVGMKRINLNVTTKLFQELQSHSKRSGRSMTELIRFALGLLHFVFTESRKNNKLVVTDSRDRVIKEVVMPW